MHCRIAGLVDLPLQMAHDDAGSGRDSQRGGVDLPDLVQALRVEENAAEYGKRAALRARAAAPRNHGNLVGVGDLHDFRDFFGCARMDDEIRLRIGHVAVMPHFGNPVVVDGVGEAVRLPDVDILLPECVGEFASDHFEHVIAGGRQHFVVSPCWLYDVLSDRFHCDSGEKYHFRNAR